MSSPFGKTPESATAGLRRQDSKHALTTCHGVTNTGRACRRPLAAKRDSPSSPRYSIQGSLVVSKYGEDLATFFCWQHKDQAEFLQEKEVDIIDVKERTSLDDMFRNLGLEDVEEKENLDTPEWTPTKTPHQRSTLFKVRFEGVASEVPSEKLDHLVDQVELESRPKEREHRQSHGHRVTTQTSKRRTHSSPTEQEGFLASLFSCLLDRDTNDSRAVPSRQYSRKYRNDGSPRQSRVRVPKIDRNINERSRGNLYDTSNRSAPHKEANERRSETQRRRNPPTTEAREADIDNRSPETKTPRRNSGVGIRERNDSRYPKYESMKSTKDYTSQDSPENLRVFRGAETTQQRPVLHASFSDSDSRQPFLARRPINNNRSKSTLEQRSVAIGHDERIPYIPTNLSPAMSLIYAKLITTVNEPPSKSDGEGYIYIFWQTKVEQTEAETNAAASLISAPLDRIERSQEEVLQRRFFQTSANASLPNPEKRTIFLKIGRARNVHQRLSEWQRQCGQNISLLRHYPCNTALDETRKVPYVGKVERLVHLHLDMLGKRVHKECSCGATHKEWFEIEATTEAVREMDTILRQWVAWSEEKFGNL